MIEISAIIEAIKTDRVRITDHADEEAAAELVSLQNIFDSVERGEIIEQYPDDKPYPSCLIYGESDGPLHSVWAYNEHSRWAVLITVYRPDPERWIDRRVRKLKQ